MMNTAKVKVPTGTKTNGNLPVAGQGIKVPVGGGPAGNQGSGNNANNVSGGNIQHPSHAKKLKEGKLTNSKAGLG